MARTFIEDLSRHVGEEVTLKGWVYNKRSSGRIRFIIMRDGTGLCQGVIVRSAVSDEVFGRFDALTQESEAKIAWLEARAARARGEPRERLEARIAEMRSRFQRRGEKVCQAWAVARQALA